MRARARAPSHKFDPASGAWLEGFCIARKMLAQMLLVVMKGKYMYLSAVTSSQGSRSPWSHVFLA